MGLGGVSLGMAEGDQEWLFGGPPGEGVVVAATHDPGDLSLADMLPAGVRLGTSSWSFPGWRGLVYDGNPKPRDLARRGLGAYSAHPAFRTVGIDRAFYDAVDASIFAEMAAQVPTHFRFLLKANQQVVRPTVNDRGDTHGRTSLATQPNPLFLDIDFAIDRVIGPAAAGLGRACGPILFQFPPMNLDPSGPLRGPDAFLDRLAEFLLALPRGPLYAVEIRNPDLLTARYAGILRAARVAHCLTVHPTMPPLARQLGAVGEGGGDATVIRWNLHAGTNYAAASARYAPFNRLVDPDPRTRAAVADLVAAAVRAARPVYVIANNKAEGSAPLTITALAHAVVARLQGTPPLPR